VPGGLRWSKEAKEIPEGQLPSLPPTSRAYAAVQILQLKTEFLRSLPHYFHNI